MTPTLQNLRANIDASTYGDEQETLTRLITLAGLNGDARARITANAADLVRTIRAQSDPGLMEVFLAEYGLSTEEGVALMCLAEALLRVPDADTMDALIEDKIAPSDWGRHLGQSSSSLVNASTWALMLTGRVLDDEEPGLSGILRGAIKRLGEPVIRTAVSRAMREMGRQFVLGETIANAMKRAAGMEAKGFTYSYDMLGEAARTHADADRYHASYSRAIKAIADGCPHNDVRQNPGISVKFSALHPRYEVAQKQRVLHELVPKVTSLALEAKAAGMGFNVDAEEADRLSLSLDVIEAVASNPDLAGWDGFGIVVQAFGQRASHVIDWVHALAQKLNRRFMVRLVKGAYWDSEIKHAQVNGVEGFPVFSRKASTDVSYIANARKLLGMTDHLYPQFATHNAHTVAAVLEMGADKNSYEFQRLHGMGEQLHTIVMGQNQTRCRIYAPVGAHRDLLAYLVRRLLENGANSSFVNQIVDEDVAPEAVAADPFAEVETYLPAPAHPGLKSPNTLFAPERTNSTGWDLAHGPTLTDIDTARAPFADQVFTATPLLAGTAEPEAPQDIINPANPADTVGTIALASCADAETALAAAAPWAAPAPQRADILNRAADLYETHYGKLFALLAREAGKTLPDAVGELREAVDFLRYYAARAQGIAAPARGTFTCISPWNFPLAIFTGQISAALATGNAVLAKPAEQTPLIAHTAVQLLHEAGVPRSALQLLPGTGAVIGRALTSDPRVDGVAFTGSTATAQTIRRAMAAHMAPGTPLIAETGGLNAMIVDSTALPEQAIGDIVQSAFQSAGQRCSALRCLYVQEDIADKFEEMLFGAMQELAIAKPWHLSTDIGPLIDAQAHNAISAYVDAARGEDRVLWQAAAPTDGHFLAPAALRVSGIHDMTREIFGPVLHIARYAAADLDQVIADINATGYGLTFGLHTRIDDRVQHVVERLHAGNTYVNRNQIGAIVGSQPFGGEGLSGTGPKAGGPTYLHRFTNSGRAPVIETPPQAPLSIDALQQAINACLPQLSPFQTEDLPGPTGESNRLSHFMRAPILCMGPGQITAGTQAQQVEALGGCAVPVHGGVSPETLTQLTGFSAALYWGDADTARAYDLALANRDGAILPLITGQPDIGHTTLERHLCIDTTASGGNAALLADIANA